MAAGKIMQDHGILVKKMPKFDELDYVRFWSKVELAANSDKCWNWKGWVASKKKPYGQFNKNRECYTTHRVAYFLQHNVDPLKMCVLHTCDNQRCVNPNHLFLGTNNDNVQDKVVKGRQAKNEAWNKGKETKFRLWDNSNCKATKKDFEKMKFLYETKGISVNVLSEKYGVAKKVVSAALRKLGVNVPKIHCDLTEKQVLEIRSKYDYEKRNGGILSREYMIGKKTIMDIVRRKTWKHL